MRVASKKTEHILLVLPSALFLFLFFLYPLAKIFILSLYERDIESSYVKTLTFNNYIHFFKTEVYFGVLVRTLKIAIIVTLGSLLLGYPIAYLISKFKKVGLFVLFVILLSVSINELTVNYAWMTILQRKGLLNQVFLMTGLISNPIQFLGTELGVIIVEISILLPFMILPIFNSLNKIDTNIIFAAKSLGANNIQVLLKIILPLTLQGTIIGSLLVFLVSLGIFITPSIIGGPKVIVMSTLITQQMLSMLNWPFASASSYILLVLIIVVAILFRKFFKLDKIAS